MFNIQWGNLNFLSIHSRIFVRLFVRIFSLDTINRFYHIAFFAKQLMKVPYEGRTHLASGVSK